MKNLQQLGFVILLSIAFSNSALAQTQEEQKMHKQPPPSFEKLLEMMDQNGDAHISEVEAKGPLKRDFDRIDTNSDGQLSKKELKQHKPPRRKKA